MSLLLSTPRPLSVVPRRVHVVSGSFGAGHDSAAREIAARFREEGSEVTVHDVVDFFPVGLGRVVRASYLWQIRHEPGSWGALLRVLAHEGAAYRATVRALSLASRLLLRAVAGADLVVSTHPFASQVLGELRRTGRLDCPAVTYLTDASVHTLWVHRDIDLHLALHEVTADQAAAYGGAVAVIAPLVPERLRGHELGAGERAALRAELGLHPTLPLAMVVGGSLGIGALAEAARDVAATGLAQPVVLCGTNRDLMSRVRLVPGAAALGWRDDFPRLLDLAAVEVQNSGGFMSREAVAAGVPVVSYRCLPGHGEANAAAMEQAGLAPWARDESELARHLARALHGRGRPALQPGRPSLTEAVTGGRVRQPA
jgi:UDP-N-acetylglucosamine:LPS N-acetylglucosamine transferase